MSVVKKVVFGQRRKKLEADIEHITAEMYKRNVELSEINKTLSLLRNIDDSLLSSNLSLEDLCLQIVTLIQGQTGYEYLGLYVHYSGKPIEELSSVAKGSDSGTVAEAIKANASSWDGSGSNTASVTTGGPYRRLYLFEVRTRGDFAIILVLGFRFEDASITEHDSVLIGRLRDSVGLVVESKLLSDENKRVLKQLERTNGKLKALDEAKDEFISMASHQLRTPLTSIKGYLSMVLEGDVGEIAPQQKEMLETAYVSAQRMVYLIADLLNVSRLQTGKFVIEPTETRLSDIVEQELTQLKESVAAKKITLTYDKPQDFPSLMLDETKIRQVIMNFIDNAVYYTPSGGNITIRLAQSPKSVEFTVVDNGIGVPKDEAHKLFTKFYRAGNARKARPDGTGLGLFMAKKVIVASGGAIIFKTKEGQGSTFGFTFPNQT